MKEEALDRTIWRNRFGGGFGRIVRNYEMNELNSTGSTLWVTSGENAVSLEAGSLIEVIHIFERKSRLNKIKGWDNLIYLANTLGLCYNDTDLGHTG